MLLMFFVADYVCKLKKKAEKRALYLFELDKLDLKDQSSIWWDDTAGARGTIGIVGAALQVGLLA